MGKTEYGRSGQALLLIGAFSRFLKIPFRVWGYGFRKFPRYRGFSQPLFDPINKGFSPLYNPSPFMLYHWQAVKPPGGGGVVFLSLTGFGVLNLLSWDIFKSAEKFALFDIYSYFIRVLSHIMQ